MMDRASLLAVRLAVLAGSCLPGALAEDNGQEPPSPELFRRHSPETTLAGSPGQPGTADGLRSWARFTDLRGLACGQDLLYVLDGHAVRTVSLPQGVVATVLGQVEAPGFRDVRAAADPGGQALRQPCLRRPEGIRWLDGKLSRDPQLRATVRTVHWSVDFLDPGGGLAEHRKGQAASADLMAVQGAFSRPGRGTVLIRCVTDEGVSAGAEVAVTVGS